MRALIGVAVVAAVACGPRPAPAPAPVPLSNVVRGCRDAAIGLEDATRDVRAPGQSILGPMHARCADDGWPVTSIDCFAEMTADDLGRCAVTLPEASREAMFDVLAGHEVDRAAIAVMIARLSVLEVGVETCDRFVGAVTRLMGCERMPIETRVQLGTETVDFWSLPTSGLPADARARISAACDSSLAALQREAMGAGCML